MIYGKYAPVPIPAPDHGSIRKYKSGYVYYNSESHWDKNKKMTVDNRTPIGKWLSGNPDLMYPNETYFIIFENKSIIESEPKGLRKSASAICSTVLEYGPYYALSVAAEKIGCTGALRKAFPKQADEILALAFYGILNEELTGQDFEFWYFHNYCGLDHCLYSSEITRLYHSMAEINDGILNFNQFFRENFFKIMEPSSDSGQKPGSSQEEIQYERYRVIAFDSTNQNNTSKHSKLTGRGHAKKQKGLPIINTAMFVDEVTGIPLYYEHFEGSITDKTQTPYTMETAHSLGFKKLFLMMDRGYYSKDMVTSVEGTENEFGVMVPDNSKIVDTMISEYADLIQNNEEYWISEEKIYGIHKPDMMVPNLGNDTKKKTEKEEETENSDQNDENLAMNKKASKYDVYLFYDDARASDERKSIHSKLDFMEKTILSKKRYTEKLAAHYEPWFIITKLEEHKKGERNFKVERKPEAIQEEIKRAGFFVIVSNGQLPAKQMIQIARKRDRSEKAFRRIKSNLGLEGVYTHFDDTYESKMFVGYIALIIEESYRWFIKPVLEATSSRTTPWSYGQLSKYQIHYNKDEDKWHPLMAPLKIQKEILSHLSKTDKDLNKSLESISLRV